MEKRDNIFLQVRKIALLFYTISVPTRSNSGIHTKMVYKTHQVSKITSLCLDLLIEIIKKFSLCTALYVIFESEIPLLWPLLMECGGWISITFLQDGSIECPYRDSAGLPVGLVCPPGICYVFQVWQLFKKISGLVYAADRCFYPVEGICHSRILPWGSLFLPHDSAPAAVTFSAFLFLPQIAHHSPVPLPQP